MTRYGIKHGLFAAFALMALFVLWNNERFLVDASSPAWAHYDPIRLHLVPHGIGGTLALALGATQFSSRLRCKHLRLHRFFGKLYLIGCFVLAPVAILMALKISPWFMTVFTIVQATTLMAFTAAAYWSIRHRNVAQHREWMVRGYAVVLVFLEGRLLMAIPAIARHGMDSVVLVNWGCFALSLVIAEFALRWGDLFPHRASAVPASASSARSPAGNPYREVGRFARSSRVSKFIEIEQPGSATAPSRLVRSDSRRPAAPTGQD